MLHLKGRKKLLTNRLVTMSVYHIIANLYKLVNQESTNPWLYDSRHKEVFKETL